MNCLKNQHFCFTLEVKLKYIGGYPQNKFTMILF